jgi:hypothetical protein
MINHLILVLAFCDETPITYIVTKRAQKLVYFVSAGAEKVIGWARNHYLSSCPSPSIKEGRLILPRESIEISVKRLKAQEDISRKPTQNLKV